MGPGLAFDCSAAEHCWLELQMPRRRFTVPGQRDLSRALCLQTTTLFIHLPLRPILQVNPFLVTLTHRKATMRGIQVKELVTVCQYPALTIPWSYFANHSAILTAVTGPARPPGDRLA